jgi:hypothetical protein
MAVLMCGNVTLVGRLSPLEGRAMPSRSLELLRRMLGVSQMRGAQSGGAALLVGGRVGPEQLIVKRVNSKRGDLAHLLTAACAQAAGGKSAHDRGFTAQAHVRYATSGITLEHEAHPFRFVERKTFGPRRVWRLTATGFELTLRSVETALTHNGDMDGLRFRGFTFSHADASCLLERLLQVKNRWVGDSPVLAAAIELYFTRGMWLESLRLAHHQVLGGVPQALLELPTGLSGPLRAAEARRVLANYPAPQRATLLAWERLAENVLTEQSAAFLQAQNDALAFRRQRDELARSLAGRLAERADPELPSERLLAFARAAVGAFFDNDLYIALRKLEPSLEGTFGCVVTSTLEPGTFIAFSRGQPLSLGFHRGEQLACAVSERAALKLTKANGEPVFRERLDLDLCRGEIASVALSDADSIRLTLYGISQGREYATDELVAAGRLVPIVDNPYVTPLPSQPEDRTLQDLRQLPATVRQLHSEFQQPASFNRLSAEAFAAALFSRQRPKLLVLGITNDLWLGEQFARNLRTLFPHASVTAISSNQVLLQPALVDIDRDSVVLAISQAGQDFPTLGALVLLQERMAQLSNDAAFVLTGELDSLMGQTVGQSYARGAPFCARVFHNASGFRPSEAALLTTNATHAALTEILLYLARHALDHTKAPAAPLGFTLTRAELHALLARQRQTLELQVEAIASDRGLGLRPKARRWTWHVLEGAFGFAALVSILELNLQLGAGLLPSRLLGWLSSLVAGPSAGSPSWLMALGAQADVAFYAFFTAMAVWALRRGQGRPTFHRQAGRELLLGDCRYVHQLSWLLARKLFSLSYGFASVKAYSADAQDELILTQEPVRGSLALLGIPDARRTHQPGPSAAATMTAKQFAFSRSWAGAGAELLTLSHGPAPAGGALGAHVDLGGSFVPGPSAKADELLENLFDSWERLLAMQVVLEHLARGVSRLWPFRYDRSRTKDQVFAPTTAAPVSAAAIYQMLARTSERYEHVEQESLPFEVLRSDYRGSAPPARTTVWRSWGDGQR